jgi:methionyl-tRNA formyltransferase
MTQKSLRIVYMGTPEFAVEPLKVLVDNGLDIAAVVTVPDKPAGRGQVLRESPVKQYATSMQLRVLQPEKLRQQSFIDELIELNADLFIVVAFRMLPQAVWSLPRLGTFNLHASLLPNYRGAAPINHAIINGETETGISTFFINETIDTGAIILQQRVDIKPTETAGTLHDTLMFEGGKLVLDTVKLIVAGNQAPVEQTQLENLSTRILPAPKIFKEDCKINFHQTAQRVHNLIRGLSPYPAAFCTMSHPTAGDVVIKIFESSISPSMGQAPGTVCTDGKTYLRVQCIDSCIDLIDIQLSGKRRLSVTDFLRGFHHPDLLKNA